MFVHRLEYVLKYTQCNHTMTRVFKLMVRLLSYLLLHRLNITLFRCWLVGVHSALIIIKFLSKSHQIRLPYLNQLESQRKYLVRKYLLLPFYTCFKEGLHTSLEILHLFPLKSIKFYLESFPSLFKFQSKLMTPFL